MYTERNQLKQQCTQGKMVLHWSWYVIIWYQWIEVCWANSHIWRIVFQVCWEYHLPTAYYGPYKQHIFTIYFLIGFLAIRKWDQAIRERNDFKDQFVKVKRQHEDAVKEINQNMNVRIKASKDIKRLTDERNAAMQVPLIKRMSLKVALERYNMIYWYTYTATM